MAEHLQNQPKENDKGQEIGPMHKLADEKSEPSYSDGTTLWDELSNPENFGNGKAVMLSFSQGKLSVIKQKKE